MTAPDVLPAAALRDPNRTYAIVRVNGARCRVFDPCGWFFGVYGSPDEALEHINRREAAIPTAAREVWLHEVET